MFYQTCLFEEGFFKVNSEREKKSILDNFHNRKMFYIQLQFVDVSCSTPASRSADSSCFASATCSAFANCSASVTCSALVICCQAQASSSSSWTEIIAKLRLAPAPAGLRLALFSMFLSQPASHPATQPTGKVFPSRILANYICW